MKYFKIAVAVILISLAAFLIIRGRSDPLGDGRRFEEFEIADRKAARRTVEKALAAIEKNDMKTLFSMMERRDRMIFDGTSGAMFAANDFTPAKIVGITGLKQRDRRFAAVDVHSDKRDKDYRFLLTKTNKGACAIVSIAEKK